MTNRMANDINNQLANEEMKRTLIFGGFTSLGATVLKAEEIEAVDSDF